jgi:hypothetical protein
MAVSQQTDEHDTPNSDDANYLTISIEHNATLVFADALHMIATDSSFSSAQGCVLLLKTRD